VGGDHVGHADGAEDFSEEADGGDAPVLFGEAGDFPVEEAVEGDHHAEALEDFGVVDVGHF
jgi:hypothetical protein